MPRYTLEERLLIVKTHYKNGGNFTVTMHRLRDYFGEHNGPSRAAIENLINNFERTFSLKDENSSNPTKGDAEVKRKVSPGQNEAAEVISNGDDAAPPAKRVRKQTPKTSNNITRNLPKNNSSKKKNKEVGNKKKK